MYKCKNRRKKLRVLCKICLDIVGVRAILGTVEDIVPTDHQIERGDV